MTNARTATAADFDKAAQKHANASWVLGAIVLAVGFFIGWVWALIPGAFLLLTIAKSAGATNAANQLRKGTYPLPNPNNGAPNGDSRNSAATQDQESTAPPSPNA